MLVLSRRLGEAIRFPGINATVQVVTIKPGVVRLGIEAPPTLTILRDELPAAGRLTDAQRGASEGVATAAHFDQLLQAVSRGLGLALLRLQAGRAEDAEALLDELHREFHRLRRRWQPEAGQARPLAPGKRRKDGAARSGPAAAHD
jgi:carbon storage regulator CsrA